jgi:hypothetical protein
VKVPISHIASKARGLRGMLTEEEEEAEVKEPAARLKFKFTLLSAPA